MFATDEARRDIPPELVGSGFSIRLRWKRRAVDHGSKLHLFQLIHDRVGDEELQVKARTPAAGVGRRPQEDGEAAGGPAKAVLFDAVEAADELIGGARVSHVDKRDNAPNAVAAFAGCS